MKALLVHGMGRTPASQLILAQRLRAAGIQPHLFGYTTFESFQGALDRLVRRIRSKKLQTAEPFALIGHSLGAVLIRSALPLLAPTVPAACFFLGSPTTACKAARYFHKHRAFAMLTGEMGARLADEAFMASLPVPQVTMRIYAGTAGPVGALSPFGNDPNDGIVTVEETRLGDTPQILVPALHSFIMNSRVVADDIIAELRRIISESEAPDNPALQEDR